MTDRIPPSDLFADRLKVEPSRKFMALTFTAGVVAIVFGLVLEFYIYKQFEFQLRDMPFLINGWFFIVVGGIATFVGFHGLVVCPTMLELDSVGIHSPKQSLSIPWEQVRSVRKATTEHRITFLFVSVFSLDDCKGAKLNRLRQWTIRGTMGDDEVPILLTGGDCDPDAVLSRINLCIASLAEGSHRAE